MDRRVRAGHCLTPTAQRRLALATLLLPPVGFLLAFYAWPLATAFQETLASGRAWEWLLTHPYPRNRIGLAFVQASLSVALTLALALPLAWRYHARAYRWGRIHLAIHAAPFVLPVFVIVYGIQGLFGAGGILDDLVGVNILATIGPLGAVVLAHAYYNYGFAARLLQTHLERRPRRLEQAARMLGASAPQAALRVSLPLLLPAMAAVAVLVFLFSFASFGVVLYLGGGRVATLDTLLYANASGGFPAWDRAAALGLLQLLLNLALLAAYQTLLRRAAPVPAESHDPLPRATARHEAVALILLLVGLLPALTVLVTPFHYAGTWTLEPLRAVLDPDHPGHLGSFDLGSAIGRSLLYAALTAAGSLTLTVLLAYGLRLLGQLPRRTMATLIALPLASSSLLLGLGYLLAFGAGDLFDLRTSPLLIVAAHTLIAFPFTAYVLLPNLEQHDRRLDEAAAMLGARKRSIAWRVHWPLYRRPIAVAAGFAAAISLGDFGASLLLMRPETMSLSVWIHRHAGVATFDPLMRAQARVLAAILMVLTAALLLVVERARHASEAPR